MVCPLFWWGPVQEHAQYCFFAPNTQCFAPGSSDMALGFFGLCIFQSRISPNCADTVIFQSRTLSLYFVAQGEVRPGASFAAKGPRSQAVSGKEQMEAQGLICNTSPQGPTGQ